MDIEEEPKRRRRASICRWLLKIYRLRNAETEAAATLRALAPNAFHEMLLDLYLAELEGRQIYQSYLASAGSPASAHRQVARLESIGAVTRSPDPADNRRLNVILTAAMRDFLDRSMDALDMAARLYLAEWPELGNLTADNRNGAGRS